jgi:transcriptional regulator with XRE-family HTH domain
MPAPPISPSKLRSAREAAGVSVEESGVATCRSARTIVGYEAGEHRPPLAIAAKLARLYGVSLDDLRVAEVVAS